ncbi:MAG: M28 family metallopeptidase [Gemmatimonadales bacterium]
MAGNRRFATSLGAYLATALFVTSCAGDNGPPRSALDAITTGDLAAAIETLASDEFEGRGPSSPGEDTTIAYISAQFEQLGLEPGNEGNFMQEVPLVSITADSSSKLVVRGGNGTQRLAYRQDYMAWTKRVVPLAQIRNSEMVFVGYGVVAPEYHWNDYEDIDVRGKTVVILVNDPGFATQDTALFNGNAMTYYGRWTYKYEEAARRGAAAALIVHETEPAAYPWEVVAGSWSGPQFGLVSDDNNMSRVAIEGWITLASARNIFAAASLSYDSLKSLAVDRSFKAVPMGLNASVTLNNRVERSVSHNVLGVLQGTDRADEFVVYMAHWDHFGRDPNLSGDQIYNGAEDNATGTAGLLQIAKAFASLEPRPSRSVLFLAVTAEEQGLLGSEYYASHPVYPPKKTVAAINMDVLNVLGPMRDISVIGYGNSELDNYLADAARVQNRVIRPDPNPEKGSYYRSDHFNFAKVGIPALYADAGVDNIEHGEEWTHKQLDDYTANRYHKPTDEFNPDWDLSGAVQDLRLLFRVGYRLANESTFPNWREGTEFRAKRDAMMGGSH